ncbi:MAG: hypothetical protein HQK54_07680 [Oligoflexales bacterium]|nr:hypothetical protein [Oligoflexales bacterium]
MDLLKERRLRRFFYLYLTGYVLSGTYGALWISDEFDYERTLLYGFFAIPAFVIFAFINLNVPLFRLSYPRFFWGWVIAIFLSFLWGNVMLLNAAGGVEKTRVNLSLKEQAFEFSYKRGGFGWLYRFRW